MAAVEANVYVASIACISGCTLEVYLEEVCGYACTVVDLLVVVYVIFRDDFDPVYPCIWVDFDPNGRTLLIIIAGRQGAGDRGSSSSVTLSSSSVPFSLLGIGSSGPSSAGPIGIFGSSIVVALSSCC